MEAVDATFAAGTPDVQSLNGSPWREKIVLAAALHARVSARRRSRAVACGSQGSLDTSSRTPTWSAHLALGGGTGTARLRSSRGCGPRRARWSSPSSRWPFSWEGERRMTAGARGRRRAARGVRAVIPLQNDALLQGDSADAPRTTPSTARRLDLRRTERAVSMLFKKRAHQHPTSPRCARRSRFAADARSSASQRLR